MLPPSTTDRLDWLDSANVFFGELTAAEARVYVELDRTEASEDISLQGRIVGPYSEYSQTLKTTVPLRELDRGATRLCAALLPDPCFWTPQLPFTYSLELAAVKDGETIAVSHRTVGLRPLGVRGSDLFLDGKRIVLRAVDQRLVPQASATDWREASATMYVRGFDAPLLEACTTHGVLALVELTGQGENLVQQLHQVARSVSAGIVLLPPRCFDDDLTRLKPRNLLLGILTRSDEPVPDDAQLIALEADTVAEFPIEFDDLSRPIVVVLNSDNAASVEQLRGQCDSLQATLAGRGRLAGYVIRHEMPDLTT